MVTGRASHQTTGNQLDGVADQQTHRLMAEHKPGSTHAHTRTESKNLLPDSFSGSIRMVANRTTACQVDQPPHSRPPSLSLSLVPVCLSLTLSLVSLTPSHTLSLISDLAVFSFPLRTSSSKICSAAESPAHANTHTYKHTAVLFTVSLR